MGLQLTGLSGGEIIRTISGINSVNVVVVENKDRNAAGIELFKVWAISSFTDRA